MEFISASLIWRQGALLFCVNKLVESITDENTVSLMTIEWMSLRNRTKNAITSTASFGNPRTTRSDSKEALAHPLHFLKLFQPNAEGVRQCLEEAFRSRSQSEYYERILNLIFQDHGGFFHQFHSCFSSAHTSIVTRRVVPCLGCKVRGFRRAVL